MPGVDALLSLTVAQAADGLTLAAGEVPTLLKAGERRVLSMPPLEPEIVRRFIAELAAANSLERYTLEGKGVRTEFDVTVAGDRGLEFRRAGAGAPPAAGETRAPDSLAAGTATAGPSEGSRAAALEALVARAIEREAMDLFLSTAADARMRIQRDLEIVPGTRCTEAEIVAFLHLDERQLDVLREAGSVDLALDMGVGRVRVNVFQHQQGLGAAIRPISRRIRSLAELGLPSDLRALAEYPNGLVLMVGPAGSGKSSTLAALIDHLNRTRARHVVTIEDPIEFEYEHGRCLIHQRELGRHVESFASGLRAALREGPDVILVGEMRDPETISAALTAAETGHLVLSTLHSGGPAMAIDRIVDAFPPHQQVQVRMQLAGALRAVVTQLLLPSVRAGQLVPAIEKAIVTHAMAHAIREGRGHQIVSQIQTGRDDGMFTLEHSLAELVRRGDVSRETAMAGARSRELLAELLGR
jgi:twitching motility protein PilT